VSLKHALETALLDASFAAVRALPWRTSLGAGAALGETMMAWGLRHRVAAGNLTRAFPEWSEERRREVLREHYRELGRVAVEYARLPELVAAPAGEVIAEFRGLEHLDALRRQGRGAVMVSGHLGNFELLGGAVARHHPVDLVVRPLSNKAVEERMVRLRTRAGLGSLDADRGVRGVVASLRAGRWVGFLADQDVRRAGIFVPFLGTLASTAVGPARLSLALRLPIVMGFCVRRPDGRHEITMEPPIEPDEPESPAAIARLTARHVARLEDWVRRRPESWFWLHRRWKTAPPAAAPEQEEEGSRASVRASRPLR